jgi:hypothetical protein
MRMIFAALLWLPGPCVVRPTLRQRYASGSGRDTGGTCDLLNQ